jgi:hypothetical protein
MLQNVNIIFNFQPDQLPKQAFLNEFILAALSDSGLSDNCTKLSYKSMRLNFTYIHTSLQNRYFFSLTIYL